MIYDKLGRLSALRCEAKIAEALAAARTIPFAAGKTELAGERLFVNGNEYASKPRDGQLFENHRAYIDVQVMVEGEEEIDVALAPDAEEEKPYDEAIDAAFTSFPEYTTLKMKKGDFAVFYPGEWHRPGMAKDGKPCFVRKEVFKVAVEKDDAPTCDGCDGDCSHCGK